MLAENMLIIMLAISHLKKTGEWKDRLDEGKAKFIILLGPLGLAYILWTFLALAISEGISYCLTIAQKDTKGD